MLSPFFSAPIFAADPFFMTVPNTHVVYRRPAPSRLAYFTSPYAVWHNSPASLIEDFFSDSALAPLVFTAAPVKQSQLQQSSENASNNKSSENDKKASQEQQSTKASESTSTTSVAKPTKAHNSLFAYAAPQFSVKKTDTELEYTISSSDAEQAPLQRENLNIELDEDKHMLSISGSHSVVDNESSPVGEDNTTKPKYKSVHKFVKSFSVPSTVKAEDIVAKWSNGQLTVKLPLPQPKPKNVKQIQVTSASVDENPAPSTQHNDQVATKPAEQSNVTEASAPVVEEDK